jgi:hypothetical protein
MGDQRARGRVWAPRLTVVIVDIEVRDVVLGEGAEHAPAWCGLDGAHVVGGCDPGDVGAGDEGAGEGLEEGGEGGCEGEVGEEGEEQHFWVGCWEMHVEFCLRDRCWF